MANNQFRYKLNRSDLLVEIGERLEIQLKESNKSIAELAGDLNKTESYIKGVIEGIAKITVEELADLFTALNKVLAIIPATRGERKYIRMDLPNDELIQSRTFVVNGSRPSGINNMRVCYEDDHNNKVTYKLLFNNNNDSDEVAVINKTFGVKASTDEVLILPQATSSQITSNKVFMKAR